MRNLNEIFIPRAGFTPRAEVGRNRRCHVASCTSYKSQVKKGTQRSRLLAVLEICSHVCLCDQEPRLKRYNCSSSLDICFNGYTKFSSKKENNVAFEDCQLGHRQSGQSNSRSAYHIAPEDMPRHTRSGVNKIVSLQSCSGSGPRSLQGDFQSA